VTDVAVPATDTDDDDNDDDDDDNDDDSDEDAFFRVPWTWREYVARRGPSRANASSGCEGVGCRVAQPSREKPNNRGKSRDWDVSKVEDTCWRSAADQWK